MTSSTPTMPAPRLQHPQRITTNALLKMTDRVLTNTKVPYYVSENDFKVIAQDLGSMHYLSADEVSDAYTLLIGLCYFKKTKGKSLQYCKFEENYFVTEESGTKIRDFHLTTFRKAMKLSGRDDLYLKRDFMSGVEYGNVVWLSQLENDALCPIWKVEECGWTIRLLQMSDVSLQSSIVSNPSELATKIVDILLSFMFYHIAEGNEITMTFLCNFFLATIFGVRIDMFIFMFGDGGTGKSALMTILGYVVGWDLRMSPSQDKLKNTTQFLTSTLITVHEVQDPTADEMNRLKKLVTEGEFVHGKKSYKSKANFMISSNDQQCHTLLKERRCFPLEVNTIIDDLGCAQLEYALTNFQDFLEAKSLFYERIWEKGSEITLFAQGTQSWCKHYNAIRYVQRESSPLTASEGMNFFSPNGNTNEIIAKIVDYCHKNASGKATKKSTLSLKNIGENRSAVLKCFQLLNIDFKVKPDDDGTVIVSLVAMKGAALSASYSHIKKNFDKLYAIKAENEELKSKIASLTGVKVEAKVEAKVEPEDETEDEPEFEYDDEEDEEDEEEIQ